MVDDKCDMSNYEQVEKSHERKRKAAYLESIFESKKKSGQEQHDNEALLTGKDTAEKHDSSLTGAGNTEKPDDASSSGNNPVAISTVQHEVSQNPIPAQAARSPTNHSNPEPAKAKRPRTSEGNQFNGYRTTDSEATENRVPLKLDVGGENTVTLSNGVKMKQEVTNEGDALPVQIVSVQGRHEEKSTEAEIGEIGDDYLKYLLFAGKLYHCERVSDLTHNYSRFGMQTHGGKGKVVVLMLFHKMFREVVNYVVGVIDRSAMDDHAIVMRIIKSHTYPSPRVSIKDLENKTSKLAIGSKKLLYNLQCLEGPVYNELVKILDGFGANSSVDHSKISEFNAMINANADRLDSQLSNYISSVSHSMMRSTTGRTFVSPTYGYLASRLPQSNPRYSTLTTRPALESPYSPVKSSGGTFSSTSERFKAAGNPHPELESVYSKSMFPLECHDRIPKGDRPVYTIAANETARISTGSYNSGACAERPRGATGIATTSGVRFYPSGAEEKIARDSSMVSQRRNVEDLQTVAELCKEKMKRDMAEQELKSIKAAFEEFKSQMQHHLSQVEERMVLLEAENRNLKGKLSNMHQSNGFAEKKYHELRSRLEDLLKST